MRFGVKKTRSVTIWAVLLYLGLNFLSLSWTAVAHSGTDGSAIEWQKGPSVGDLGGVGTISIPSGYAFTGAAGAKQFLEAAQNPPGGREVGLLVPIPKHGVDQNWFMLFEFVQTGYIHDDEKGSLDQNALLASLKRNTEDANAIRRKKGWRDLHVKAWSQPPFYDIMTHNLTWGVLAQGDGEATPTANYSVRILGRRGTMKIDLVVDPRDLPTVLPEFSALLGSFSYKSGSRYIDFVKGDKAAGYGLTALIAGGVGAAAIKTGLLATLWKMVTGLVVAFYKLLLLCVAALLSAISGFFKKTRAVLKPKTSGTDPKPPKQFRGLGTDI